MPDNFFAILMDGEVRRISLVQDVEENVRAVFVGGGQIFIDENEEVEFDGSWKLDDDEIFFVPMNMGDYKDVVDNPINIPILDLRNEAIRALFWYENQLFYFQNFDSRKLLQNRNVIVYNRQTYDRLRDDAFIIDNMVSAVHQNGKFYFRSYANANKIFDLSDYYKEATDKELKTFSEHPKIAVTDLDWLREKSNSVIRKNVKMLQDSGVLDGADTKKIRKDAHDYNLDIKLDKMGKIVLPKDRRQVKDILLWLNEGYFKGAITGAHYKTNSKKKAL